MEIRWTDRVKIIYYKEAGGIEHPT